jgi:uncharacterized protein (TIGR00255 family)
MAVLNSMTGFGHVEVQIPNAQLQWEVRSVNHRYLDIHLKVPEGFRAFEQAFRQLIAASVRRGKVDATLSINKNANSNTETRINSAVSRQIIDHLEALSKQMKAPAPITPEAVLRWPGVLEEDEIDPGSVFPNAKEALEAAVAELASSRTREGRKINEMLEQRCVDIESVVQSVSRRLPEVLIEMRKRLELRLETLNAQVDNDRLEQEVLILTQKMDISEELDRLTAHIEEVRSVFNNDEPVGRRLDFLMQELNREANTIGSKSADTETTRQAVDLKVLIEQMREQVQNVE